MNNTLRQIETDEVVIYKSHTYSADTLKKCRHLHDGLVEAGKLEGEFEDDKWMGYSGIRRFGMDFSIDPESYKKHVGKEFGISLGTMKNMLRCYAIYCNGVYIYQTISRNKLGVIRLFLEEFPGKNCRLPEHSLIAIEDFLAFIGTPDAQIQGILNRIARARENQPGQRHLSPVINYLVVENEINSLFRSDPDEETFRKWFPIYFWVNITFILPLRATEMLVTPRDCLRRTEDGKVFLTVRRTCLKKGSRTVYYDVNKDYKEFSYEIPDAAVAVTIEKYLSLTSGQERRFLFEYNELMINGMLSLKAFNYLLSEFMEERVIGNPRYDFAKFASGIQEFEKVTAGDSRPIAMANLYFQNAGEDICRQLADHVHIDTSSSYYTNISETIWASSVIRMQKRMEYESRDASERYRDGQMTAISSHSQCLSPLRQADEENLDDCISEGHLADCMGCRYYLPSRTELEGFLKAQQKRADDGAKRVIEFMNSTMKAKKQEVSMEELFLSVQTDASRYRMGCDLSAKEKYSEWQEHKSSRKTCF